MGGLAGSSWTSGSLLVKQHKEVTNHHESGGVKVSAFQLSLRADVSRRGEYPGPQILLLSVGELFGLFLE
ncbi:hypothetical protein CapIbe_020552 [Capra ibex]